MGTVHLGPASREQGNSFTQTARWLMRQRSSICDIYDWDGKGEIDLFFLGDVMYALGLNITKKACVAQGQTDEEGKKFAKYDDIVEKVKAAVATPDSQGGYADYLELLKLYDKNSNGTMMLAELDNILCNLGDEVPKDDVQ